MSFELKRLSKESIPRAHEKAERYRLLREPGDAESICLDILAVEPDNQKALVNLLLARTDQFAGLGGDITLAREVLPRLKDEYQRTYYAGIICERRAKAHLANASPGSGFSAYALLREAMDWYEKAATLRPPGNDDALLRWNACVRLLERHPTLQPLPEERSELPLE